MTRKAGRILAIAVAAALVGSSFAQAAVIGTSTLVRDPSAGNNFTNPDAALGAPWVAYRLSLEATEGQVIQAVEANISGQLHQRWTDPDDGGAFNATGNSTNQTNGDSHFMATASMLFASGPTEDNPGTGSPLSAGSTTTSLWGVGTSMSAVFGPPGAGVTNLNVAYLVVPKGTEPQLDIRVSVLNPTGDVIGLLEEDDFFDIAPPNLTPIVSDKAVEYTSVHPSTIVSESLTLVDDGPAGTWSLDSFVSPNGQPASVDPTTGVFTWLGNGTPEGVYNAVLKYTDGGGLSDVGTLAITWHVPEPTSFALLGLALVGFAGCRRK